MAKSSTQKAKRAKPESVELVPDAWPRFEKFIKQAAKAGPQHRTAKPKAAKSKGRKGR